MTDLSTSIENIRNFLPFLLRVVDKMKQFELIENDLNALINCLNQFINFNGIKNRLQHEINCFLLRKKRLEDELPNG